MMMTVMVKTISTLCGANHHNGPTVRRRGQLRSLLSFSPRCIWPASGRDQRESDHVGAFPNILVKESRALPFLSLCVRADGRTDSYFAVDSSVILNQVYTFARRRAGRTDDVIGREAGVGRVRRHRERPVCPSPSCSRPI